jgi:hypothetical protein
MTVSVSLPELQDLVEDNSMFSRHSHDLDFLHVLYEIQVCSLSVSNDFAGSFDGNRAVWLGKSGI